MGKVAGAVQRINHPDRPVRLQPVEGGRIGSHGLLTHDQGARLKFRKGFREIVFTGPVRGGDQVAGALVEYLMLPKVLPERQNVSLRRLGDDFPHLVVLDMHGRL